MLTLEFGLFWISGVSISSVFMLCLAAEIIAAADIIVAQRVLKSGVFKTFPDAKLLAVLTKPDDPRLVALAPRLVKVSGSKLLATPPSPVTKLVALAPRFKAGIKSLAALKPDPRLVALALRFKAGIKELVAFTKSDPRLVALVPRLVKASGSKSLATSPSPLTKLVALAPRFKAGIKELATSPSPVTTPVDRLVAVSLNIEVGLL